MQDKITVIVPVYKVEPYLHKCVDSILAQTYTNLEVILVDDGSPDRCGAICDEYAKKDSRIQVIHQENRGLSAARNAGLDVASGDWIGFVDSDDWIQPQMYEKLIQLAQTCHADIAQCGVGTDIPGTMRIDREIILEISSAKMLESAVSGAIAWTAWCNLYRAEVWQTLRYPAGYYYEDVLTFPAIVDRCNRFVKTNDPLYYYNRRPEGILRQRKTKLHLLSKEKVFEVYDQYFSEHPEQAALGGLYMVKNIPAYRSIIMPNEAITRAEAHAHNQKMHRMFRRYYPLAKQHPAYRMEPWMKRVLWSIYGVSPTLANWLLNVYKK